MTDEQIALARRAVACKGWRWLPGMKDLEGWRLYRELPLGGWDAIGGEWEYHQVAHYPKLPDLTDPATVGCLLALVREAWDAPRALVRLSANGKSFHVFDVDRVTTGGNWAAWLCGDRILQTEAEALVAALEAAP